ncbi:hypothetical protein D3C85_1129820 [compost metagenome]
MDVALFDGATAVLPLHVREVHVALGILQGRVVEIDVLGGRNASELTFSHGDKDLGHGHRAQAIRRLGRGLWLIRSALGAENFNLLYCAHAFLQAIKNRLMGGCGIRRFGYIWSSA